MMADEKLKIAFNDLIDLLESLVKVSIQNAIAKPYLIPTQKWQVLDHVRTDSGVIVSKSQTNYIYKHDWGRAANEIADNLNSSPQFCCFRDSAGSFANLEVSSQLRSALVEIAKMAYNSEIYDRSVLLDYFLKSLTNSPVPAWGDIEVYGVLVNGTKNISIVIGDRRFTFRQIEVEDFEYEVEIYRGDSKFGIPPPNSILTINMDSWRVFELQAETEKALIVLRLFRVCSARFKQQKWGSSSPFAVLFGSTNTNERFLQTPHIIPLTSDISDELRNFWMSVEPKLLHWLGTMVEKKVTPVSIAYERYCDALLSSHPIDRKIAFAVMGLEAIYLAKKEAQELVYRLQLKLCKFMTKLNQKNEDVQLDLKTGYKIRSSYVHGGHLSSKEHSDFKKKGIVLDQLAFRLLDYLRVSMLHLILSGQSKEDFLNLLEESFIDREQDNKLQSLIESEKSLLMGSKL